MADRVLLLSEDGVEPRRGFLRKLLAAPVAALATHRLILPAQTRLLTTGTQIPADERESLLNAYHCWLTNERLWLAWERAGDDKNRFDDYLNWVFFAGHNASTFHPRQGPPTSRALTVLSAVGCDWRQGAAA